MELSIAAKRSIPADSRVALWGKSKPAEFGRRTRGIFNSSIKLGFQIAEMFGYFNG